ncbi:MFS Git1p-like glycerophosphoinositol permease [Rhodofomes roseus]|uniref:MFS Git1p-like glycerophosphoinositol permease n=1 Tax=Rhodofomes roseus TaxID=34475 RepID=A0ABQ8KE17_9APHY|nr:MFS Git1p-like glycerophosphoinositol permease [Rhodofomes roseus]KAH9835369.1 MFS Git1p-like glycerophosphoinositol permease [Rhodofomes roseus]
MDDMQGTPALQDLVSTRRSDRVARKVTLGAYMAIAASAFGLISDGYHNNLMTMTNVVFKKLYPTEYTSNVSTRVSNAMLVGEVIGQVFVGILCDRHGRKSGLVMTTLLIIVGAILCTVAHGAHGGAQSLFWFMTIARGVTGVGAGGEYPASSTSASEGANETSIEKRGPVFIMVTDLPLVCGGPLAVSVFLIVLSAAGQAHLETIWRVCFGVGIALPMTVFYFRMRMLNSKLYREGAIRRRVPYWLSLKRYWKALIGTGGSWFLFDFIFYPNGIFSASIISSVIKDGDVKATAEWQLLLGAIAIPGVFVGALLCNPLGRRNTMILGFSGYVIFGLIIGIGYDKVTRIVPLFIVLYGLMTSMSNLGPGNMTLLTSAESYPTPIRGTFFGLSAALGKAGAAVGTEVFTPIQDNLGKRCEMFTHTFAMRILMDSSLTRRWTFIVAAIFGALGILVTYLFVPDMTGIDLALEDTRFLRYLAENGWDGDVGIAGDTGPLGTEEVKSGSSKGYDDEEVA